MVQIRFKFSPIKLANTVCSVIRQVPEHQLAYKWLVNKITIPVQHRNCVSLHLNFPRQGELEQQVKNYNFQWKRKRPSLNSATTRQEPSEPYFKKTKNKHLHAGLSPQRSTTSLCMAPGPRKMHFFLCPTLWQPQWLRKLLSSALSQKHASQ